MKISSRFTLVEIMIVIAIIGVLAAIAIPNLMSNRQASMERTEEANAKMIKTACSTFLGSNHTANQTDAIAEENFSNYLNGNLADMAVGGTEPTITIIDGRITVHYGSNSY